MNIAIKILLKKIQILNKELEKAEGNLEEPELTSDYYFAMNDLINIESEILELQKAIKILLQHNETITKWADREKEKRNVR